MTVQKQFKEIAALVNKASKIEGDEYYKLHETIKEKLILFIREDFEQINKKQILQLCHMVYKYNAGQPHSFLMRCGTQAAKL